MLSITVISDKQVILYRKSVTQGVFVPLVPFLKRAETELACSGTEQAVEYHYYLLHTWMAYEPMRRIFQEFLSQLKR